MTTSSQNTSQRPTKRKRQCPKTTATTPNIESYVQYHNEHVAALFSKIDSIQPPSGSTTGIATTQSSSANNGKDSISATIQEMSSHFISLKQSQRAASLMLEQKTNEVKTKRQSAEAGHLILQNLAYEKAHLLREIRTCRDCPSRELEKMCRDEYIHKKPSGTGVGKDGVDDDNDDGGDEDKNGSEQKDESMDTTATTSNDDDEDEDDKGKAAIKTARITQSFLGENIHKPQDRAAHQAVLNKLTNEINTREKLQKELEEMKVKRSIVESEIESKRRFLSSLPKQLDVLEKATLPLQEYLKLQSSERKVRFARASKLCRPLYILCCQLEAYADAFGGENMTVEVADSVPYNSLKEGDRSEGDQGSSSSSDKGQEEENRESKSDDPATMSSSSSILQPDTLAVLLKLYPEKSSDTTSCIIRFQYLQKLNVITAEAIDNPQLLINLFPSDTGEVMPNLSTYHTANQSASFKGLPSDYPGRPYLWAQWLAGLVFLSDASAPPVDDQHQGYDKKERLEPSTRTVIRQLHRRIRAHRVLKDLLAKLSQTPNPIPVHPTMKSSQLFPPTILNNSDGAYLEKWKQIPSVDTIRGFFGHCANSTGGVKQQNNDNDSSSYGCQYYTAIIKRRNSQLKAMVEISPDYPAVAPRWLLQSPPQSNRNEEHINTVSSMPLYDDNLKQVESQVNAEYSSTLVDDDNEETFDWLLVHQLRKIITCWDALGDGPDHGTLGGMRVRRGRDRRKMLAFERYAKGKK